LLVENHQSIVMGVGKDMPSIHEADDGSDAVPVLAHQKIEHCGFALGLGQAALASLLDRMPVIGLKESRDAGISRVAQQHHQLLAGQALHEPGLAAHLSVAIMAESDARNSLIELLEIVA